MSGFDLCTKWAYNVSMCKFCDKPIMARGMCGIHYARWRRTGNPEISQRGKRTDVQPIEERMKDYIVSDSCWLWNKGLNIQGYGKVKYNGHTLAAHVVSYYLAYGCWPSADIDHGCHTLDSDCVGGINCMHRRCINPEHLEVVGSRENTRRRDIRVGIDQSSRIQKEIKRKHLDVCGKGHEYTKENTRVTPKGHRSCRTCAREYARGYRKR